MAFLPRTLLASSTANLPGPRGKLLQGSGNLPGRLKSFPAAGETSQPRDKLLQGLGNFLAG
jgi:hypothetical protein